MGFTALIAGGLGLAGSIGSASIQSNAASAASQQQVNMQQAALAQQKALYNQGLGVQSQYLGYANDTIQPFAQAGQGALPTLQKLLTPGPNQTATLSQIPGVQFASQYGTMAATNALAAKGLGASAGPLATAISQYNQGLASGQFQNIVGDIQGFANMGTNAAGTIGNIFGNAGNAALNGGIQAGNAQAQTLTGIGQAQAAGTLGSANALAGGFTGGTNALSNAALYSAIGGSGGGGLYGNVGSLPATGAGAPNDLSSNFYALSQGINPFG